MPQRTAGQDPAEDNERATPPQGAIRAVGSRVAHNPWARCVFSLAIQILGVDDAVADTLGLNS